MDDEAREYWEVFEKGEQALRLLHYGPVADDLKIRLLEVQGQARQIEELKDSLREMRGLASVCIENDPWYAEHAGLDHEAIFARTRKALGE